MISEVLVHKTPYIYMFKFEIENILPKICDFKTTNMYI